jgi:predicted DNA-binding transcriptional regulator AlpA
MDKLELVGQKEIAEMCGVSQPAVANWRRRYSDFPKPHATLACGSIWLKSDIQEYMDKVK